MRKPGAAEEPDVTMKPSTTVEERRFSAAQKPGEEPGL